MLDGADGGLAILVPLGSRIFQLLLVLELDLHQDLHLLLHLL